MEVKQYKKKMREHRRERNFRARFRDVTRQTTEEVEQQLSELGFKTHGSHRAKGERLFRGILRTAGVADVPWYPDQDKAGGIAVPEAEEWLMEQSDRELESEAEREQRQRQQKVPWPSNRGLPPFEEETATANGTQTIQRLSNNMTSSTNIVNHPHQAAALTDNANTVSRITVQDEGETNSTQYLLPPESNFRDAFATLRLRRDIPRSFTTPADSSRVREGGRDVQRSTGTKPKETWYRSRLSTTAQNLEDRDELDDEYLPNGKDFIRVNHQPNPRTTPRRSRKILLPRESSSDAEGYSPPSLSSSRLRADFRDLSPESEAESRGRQTITARDGAGARSLAGAFRLRYSGEEKESPEQFLL